MSFPILQDNEIKSLTIFDGHFARQIPTLSIMHIVKSLIGFLGLELTLQKWYP